MEFATNSLVVIVPKRNRAKIKTIFDLAKRPNLKLVVCGPKVPIGLYTREVLKRLKLLKVLKKTVSTEPDVKGIVGKVALGQADAGFVYRTDVAPVAGRVKAISIPARAQPTVIYELAIAAEPQDLAAAQDFVIAVLGPDGRRKLKAARFGLLMRPTPFGVVLAVSTTATIAFLVVPIVAIFAELSLAELRAGLTAEVTRDALRVTAETNLSALALIVLFGTPTAYLVATRSFRGRALLVTLIELPLVLPPAVAGIGLLAAFGTTGLLGGTVEAFGWDIAFTKIAVVLAVTYVASPFYVRTAIAAFEAVDRDLVAAARTLGAGPARTFARIALPLAAGGLGAGAALAFARGLGEFGATIMFAGSLQGVTQTLSLAVYQEFDVDFETALAIGGLLVVASALVLLAAKLLVPAWRRSVSRSITASAPSVSR